MNDRVLILNDGSRCENWGIKACIDGLRIIIRHENPEVELGSLDHIFMHRKYVFESKFFGSRTFTPESRFAGKFFKKFQLLPRIADEYERVAELWLSGNGGPGADTFIRNASGVDAIVFNAEGSTYRDTNIGAQKGLFMLWFAKTKLNKKALFLNGSVTLTRVDATLPAIVRKVFGAIDLVAVREPDSQRNVIEYCPDLKERILMCPDSTFVIEADASAGVEDVNRLRGEFFVFSLSMLPMDLKAVVRVIRELKNIVPRAVLIAKDAEDQILKQIAKETDSSFIGPTHTYLEVMNVLEKAAFLFSGRYHHLIFAAKAGCPVIPMRSTSQKVDGLTSLFEGIMPRAVDPTDLGREDEAVLSTGRAIAASGGALRERYRSRAAQLGRDALQFSKRIKDVLHAP